MTDQTNDRDKWFPLSDCYPPAYETVLVCWETGRWVPGEKIDSDCWGGEKNGWRGDLNGITSMDMRTHWRLMPLGPRG